MVEKSGVETFIVEKSGVEAGGWKIRGWDVLQPIDQSIASTKIKYIKLNTKTHELCFLNLTLYDISLLGIEKHILFVCYLEKNIVKPLVHKTTNSTKEKILPHCSW